MRVVPRRSKDREAAAPVGDAAPPRGGRGKRAKKRGAPPPAQAAAGAPGPAAPGADLPGPAGPGTGLPGTGLPDTGLPDTGVHGMGAPGAGVSTTDVSTTGVSTTGAPPVLDEAQRRRARAVERQRRAAELKKSRTAQRQATGGHERREREHRSALLVMVLTLGLLIAAVAVTGGMIAASMRTRPVALAAPLHVYPVTQTVPGPCQAGTQGITGQTASGQVCYQLAQGIAIRKVADLRQQKARGAAHDVAVTLRADDRKAFAALTKTSVGRDLAFVVGDRLVTTSRVDMEISDGKFILTGSSSQAEADRLVRDLKGR